MRRHLLWLLIAGCDHERSLQFIEPDARHHEPPCCEPCNPIAQTGCNVGEKCTWILDESSPPIGFHGCVPLTGNEVAIGEACEAPAPGSDNCARGAICANAVCEQICDPQAHADSDGCDAEHTCILHDGLFEYADMGPWAGGCELACDPLTQTVGGVPACGSSDPASPERGCYTRNFEAFGCLDVAAEQLALGDRAPAAIGASGKAIPSGCAPGFVPFAVEMTGSMRVLCAGLCAPLEIDNTQPQNALGDASVVAKLPLEAQPAAGNATCAIGKKGSEPQQDCVFLWAFLANGNGEPTASRWRETLGVCFAYTHFQFDSDNNGFPDAPFPGCENLPPRSAATAGLYDDAADFGCQTIAHSPGPVWGLVGMRPLFDW